MTTHNPNKPVRKADWNAIELEYRAGIKSLEQIGKEYGVTKGRISQVAKKQEWTRDLAAKIRAKADARVNEAAVNLRLNTGQRLAEKTVVEANATLQYRIRMEHRADIARTRQLFQTLLAELELSCTRVEAIQSLFDEVHPAPDADAPQSDHSRYARLTKALNDVLSIPGRVDSAKKITEMLEKLVRLEREAFGIKTDEGGGEAKSRVVFLPCKDAE